MTRRRPAAVAPPTPATHLDFQAYFNVADELDGGLTLADLDRGWIARANKAAADLGLSWPPYLAEAEDYALSHPEWVRGLAGW